MKKQNIFVIIISLFVGMILWSCDNDDESDLLDIRGVWLKTEFEDDELDSLFIIFEDGGVVTYTVPGWMEEEPPLTGSYLQKSDNILELTDLDCTESDLQTQTVGRYRLNLVGDSLEFVLVDDKCERSEVITGFAKRSEPEYRFVDGSTQ